MTGANPTAPSDVVFERRPGLVLRTLLASLWTWAWLVGDAIDLESWREALAEGPSGAVLFIIVAGLVGFVYESVVFFRFNPREVRIDGGHLRLQFSKDRELAIALDEIREVRTTPKLTLVLLWGEVYEFNWRKAVRTKVLSALEASLHLQPVPGDTSGSLLRPLLFPGEPIADAVPPGDRDCARCGNHYPSHYWFVVDAASREVVCRPCAEQLALDRAEARIAATGSAGAQPPAVLGVADR